MAPNGPLDDLTRLVAQTLRLKLTEAVENGSLSLDELTEPSLHIEGYLQNGQSASSSSRDSRNVLQVNVDLNAYRDRLRSETPSHGARSYGTAMQDVGNISATGVLPTPQSTPGHIAYSSEPSTDDMYIEPPSPKRRKAAQGLSIPAGSSFVEEHEYPDTTIATQSRKEASQPMQAQQPSNLDKVITSIWEQMHGSVEFNPQNLVNQWEESGDGVNLQLTTGAELLGNLVGFRDDFSRVSIFCRKVTQASRCFRSLEIVVQARWIELFEARVEQIAHENIGRALSKNRKEALVEACQAFQWTEKEMRNKMAIWRGYREIKDAAGWSALVFSGNGIYRFCKYRQGFEKEDMQRLRNLRPRFEVAADTLHPHWRQLLVVIGEPTDILYHGHPHDWVVGDRTLPIPLATTYLQWDPHFTYHQLQDSFVDPNAWGTNDPRFIVANAFSPTYICRSCDERQSDDPKSNECQCFPNLYGGKRTAPPVQVFRTPNGRNNGLLALLPFEAGTAVGEFVGMVTRGLSNMDVMEGQTDWSSYQIWQGRQGNYTRFVNHSCVPNAQFERFVWMGTQRIVLVSKGIVAGQEITVDYSDRYWKNLDKVCLCGEEACRYRNRLTGV